MQGDFLFYNLAAFFCAATAIPHSSFLIPNCALRALTKDRFWEIFRFLAVGGGCFLLDWGLLFVLHEYAGFTVLMASGTSFTVSLVVNYLLCVTVVFHANKRTPWQTFLFVVTSLAGLGINQLCMWGFTALTGEAWYMADKIGAAAVVTIWNYITKRMVLKGN